MATTYTWKVPHLERETKDGYVYLAQYTITAEDGTYSTGAYGTLNFERPETDLIPFDSLTEELVVGWIKEKLTAEKVEEIENALQVQLDERHSPTRSGGTPWQDTGTQIPQIVPPQIPS